MYEKLEYVDTYKMLIVKYDQNEQYEMDAASGSTSAAGGSGEVQGEDNRRGTMWRGQQARTTGEE